MNKLLPLGCCLLWPTVGFALEFSGNFSVEGRHFVHSPLWPEQAAQHMGLSIQPELRHRWDNGRKIATFIPFYHWDAQDEQHRYSDIRQFDLVLAQGDWEIQAGISKVFWGVTESQHLVDIINQTDNLAGIDGEEKLGQPLLRLSRLLANGALDFYVLPYFRERQFAGNNSRLRPALPVLDEARYESEREQQQVDIALRWAYTYENIDLAAYWFKGTARQPLLQAQTKNEQMILQPYYPQINQTALTLQHTGDAWLWKLEALYQKNHEQSHAAAVGGFEYTWSGVFDSAVDLGLLAEYHRDSRGLSASNPWQKDLFIGNRWGFNDVQSTEILAGVLVDLDQQGRSLRIEASRRLGDNMKLNFESQWFSHAVPQEAFYDLRADDYLQLEWQWFF